MRQVAILSLLASMCYFGFEVAGLSARINQEASAEDKLHLQVVLLRGQLAEALKAQAKCEAEGSQAAQQLQTAQSEGQALLKALEARGLMVDEHNAIVAKPKDK